MALSRHARGVDIPLLEWIAAAIGLALVCGAIVTMAWLGITRGDAPPAISLRVEAVSGSAKGYVVTIRALNSGGTTAAGVTVEGELRRGAVIVETSTMTFSYLPPDSERRGGLFFEKDPRALELTLKAKGYETP